MSIINRNMPSMTSLNLIQRFQPIGEIDVGEDVYPPRTIIWLGVRPGTVGKAQAEAVTALCRTLVDSLTVDTIYIEVHEEIIESYATPKFLPNDLTSPTRQYELPFLLGMGWNVAPVSQVSSRGSCGLFIGLEGMSETFVTTCQHCLTPINTLQRLLDDNSEREKVTLMSPRGYEMHIQSIRQAEINLQNEIAATTRTICRLGSADVIRAEIEGDKLSRLSAREREMEALASNLDEVFGDIEERHIGSVACHPSITSRCSPLYPWRFAADPFAPVLDRDWGLIQLNTDIVSPAKSPNIIHLCEPLPTQPIFSFSEVTKMELALHIDHIVPMSEYHRREIHCMKFGAVSGLTIGTVHPCRAVKRELGGTDENGFPIGQYRDSLVLPIHGINQTDFSTTGDSGSVVVDEKGGAIAFVIAGSDKTRITYSIPAEFVMDDIQQFTGLKPYLL